MKKVFILALVLAIGVMAFNFQSTQTSMLNNIVVQFVTTNDYGNNIYVDNFSIGTQFQSDVAVTAINIPKDSNYSTNGSNQFKVLPKVTIANIGSAASTAFNVVLNAGTYTSTKSAPVIVSGGSVDVEFDSLTIVPNTVLNIKTYSTWSADQNKSNDTLSQYTLYMPGAQRKVVFEAFTASTCGPCASQNPSLDAFIAARIDSIVPVKTHVWWPSPGNDPMYLANTTQIQPRVQSYYAVSAVPTLIVDGIIVQVSGYTTPSNLLNPYTLRMSKGSPLSVNVVDTKIAGDSIKTNITVTVISPLPAGNYRLRAYSQSTKVSYASPPGTNGESTFKDVFRFGYPDMTGTTIPTTPGTYNFEFRYKLTPFANATDTSYYTAAFVQNDATKEIINAGKAPHVVTTDSYVKSTVLSDTKPMPLPSFVNNNNTIVSGSQSFSINSGFNYQVFESGFPPAGWQVVNPNAGSLTWEGFSGANGPYFSGIKSTRVNCYSYSTRGQKDNLVSSVFNNVDLADSLRFNWAHAIYNTSYNDRLAVQVSTDGGVTFPYTIFDKAGSQLATAPASTSDFVPSASQWGSFAVSVQSFIVSIQQIGTEVPSKYALNQNYPNPFNPTTNISYMIPKSSQVSLKVYDIKGQLISTLYEGTQNAGIYLTQFDGSKLASGIYFYKLEAGDYSEVRKMTMIK